MALLALCICFVVLLVIGFPIAFNLILSSIVYLLVGDYPLTLVPQRMFQGMNGFALLAVPFFILTGQLMVKGSLLKSLTDFVNAFVGHVRGALALVTVSAQEERTPGDHDRPRSDAQSCSEVSQAGCDLSGNADRDPGDGLRSRSGLQHADAGHAGAWNFNGFAVCGDSGQLLSDDALRYRPYHPGHQGAAPAELGT